MADHDTLVTIESWASSSEIASKAGVESAQDIEHEPETEGMLPGPATLWGILLSETATRATANKSSKLPASELLDGNSIINLWNAAGYECQIPVEHTAASPAVTNAMLIKDEETMQLYQYSDPVGPYIVKEAPGKGQGIFTTRDVVKGERILVDKPFFVVTKPYNDRKVLAEFEHMPLARRQQYMRLRCPDRSDDKHLTDVMRIFEANCFNIGDKAAMFLTATRFNHSCLPNTYYSWSKQRGEIVIHSMIDIPEGQEVTISYGHPFCTSLQRRYELRIYNFLCSCPACRTGTAFGQASDSRRLAMKALNEEITTFQNSWNEALVLYMRDPLKAILEIIEVIKEEGLHGELMTQYHNAADCLKGRGNFEEALKFAHWELEQEVFCLGNDSEVVHKTVGYIEALELELEKAKEEEAQDYDDAEELRWRVDKAPGNESTDSEVGIEESVSEREEKLPVLKPNASDMATDVKLENHPTKEAQEGLHGSFEYYSGGHSNDPQIDSRSSSPRLVREK